MKRKNWSDLYIRNSFMYFLPFLGVLYDGLMRKPSLMILWIPYQYRLAALADLERNCTSCICRWCQKFPLIPSIGK